MDPKIPTKRRAIQFDETNPYTGTLAQKISHYRIVI